MKTHILLPAVVLSCFASNILVAQQTLSQPEIIGILETLTAQMQRTWIPSGTIIALHQEYRAPKTTNKEEINEEIQRAMQDYKVQTNKPEISAKLQRMRTQAIPFNMRYRLSNEYTMASHETVRYDGDRFYWAIDVASRTDSVRPKGNSHLAENFNMKRNRSRIFAWDGQDYTCYYRSANQAVRRDGSVDIPHVVNGPLTAGFIPWGFGDYTYQRLTSAESSAFLNDLGQTELTLSFSEESQMQFILDTTLENLVLLCAQNLPNGTLTVKTYDNHVQIGGRWVPTSITIEQYESNAGAKLLASDVWEFTHIDGSMPPDESFAVPLEKDTLVEYYGPEQAASLQYRYSQPDQRGHHLDSEELLAERLALAATADDIQIPRNCATVALKRIGSQLDIALTDQELAPLVIGSDKHTSLYDLQQFALDHNLYSMAVKADIETLKEIDDCEVLLHSPANDHFTVLGNIDDQYVRLIDLQRRTFLYRRTIDEFADAFSEGAALLVSVEPIQLKSGSRTLLTDEQLQDIVGADECEFGCYDCTDLIQSYYIEYCTMLFNECMGRYKIFSTRYGPKSATSGTIVGTGMLSFEASQCIVDMYDPLACSITGSWTSYDMRACD